MEPDPRPSSLEAADGAHVGVLRVEELPLRGGEQVHGLHPPLSF
jgi:hypothetical protein